MSDPRKTVRLTEAESVERPMTHAEVMALKLRMSPTYEERKHLELMDRLVKNRVTVSESKDDSNEGKQSSPPNKSKWGLKDYFQVYIWSTGALIILSFFLAPKKSFNGATMPEISGNTVFFCMAGPALLLIVHCAFVPLMKAIYCAIVMVAKFLIIDGPRNFRKSSIQILKLTIRGVCGIPNTLKQIEKWSRER